VSTAYVAGTHRGVFGEDDLDRGQGFNNAYERSKWEAERLVAAHAERLPIQVLRPSIVVGDERTGWTSSFNVIYSPLKAYARGALSAVPARRSAPVDVVSVSYVADAILALAATDAPCRTYNLSAGSATSTVRELVGLSARRLGRKPLLTLPPRVYRHVLHPLLMRRSSGARRRWLERSGVFFPYFAADVRFDTRHASAVLDPLGLRPSPLPTYFDRLIDYAEGVDWGRQTGLEPLAGAPASASSAAAATTVTGRPATV
jgi:long-chain acyl-CoA synthetase